MQLPAVRGGCVTGGVQLMEIFYRAPGRGLSSTLIMLERACCRARSLSASPVVYSRPARRSTLRRYLEHVMPCTRRRARIPRTCVSALPAQLPCTAFLLSLHSFPALPAQLSCCPCTAFLLSLHSFPAVPAQLSCCPCTAFLLSLHSFPALPAQLSCCPCTAFLLSLHSEGMPLELLAPRH
jgi:hypothetical protein